MRVDNCQVIKKWYFRVFFPIQSVVDLKKNGYQLDFRNYKCNASQLKEKCIFLRT